MSYLRFLLAAALFAVLAGACGGGGKPGPVDSYVALVPRVLRAGETESVSLTLFSRNRLVAGDINVALRKDNDTVIETSGRIDGKGTLEVQVPDDATGEYQVIVKGPGFEDKAPVQVQDGTLLFLETDKPIYKPGQSVHIRVVSLNSELKPVSATVSVAVQDAKGIKVFKQDVTTDEFGMATLELPLSTEPNLGVWKLSATAGDTSTEVDVRVEEYVLPKYDVSVDLPKEWFLVDETISGKVSATYSFGKPVRGDLTVRASRYVGVWEEFATVNAAIDGEGNFELPAAGYVAGVPEAGGLGNVTLDVTVVERNTGYEEKTTQLVTVAAAPVNIQIVPEGPVFKPGLPFNLLLVTETPAGEPVESDLQMDIVYLDEDYQQVSTVHRTLETKRGTGVLDLNPPDDAFSLSVTATSGEAYAYKQVTAAYSPSGNFIHVEQVTEGTLSVGDRVTFRVASTSDARRFYYEVVSRDRVVFTGSSDSRDISFALTPAMTAASKLLVYQILPTSEVAADFIPFEVEAVYPHQVTATFSGDEVRPGDDLQVDVQTQGPAKVGLVAVDRSVFILAENRLNLQQVFAELERLYQQPQAELHEAEFIPGPIVIPGALETFEDAGMTVLTNKRVPEGKEIERFFGEGDLFFDAAAGIGGPLEEKSAADAIRGAPLPATGTSSTQLAEVQRVRQFFPETWIWDELTTDAEGRGTFPVQAPDSITTWDLRAVAVSPEHGLGVAEAELRVFQAFFLQADLPYSAIRGEEFPLKVSLYNYQDSEQQFQVEIEPQDWFDLLDDAAKTVTVGPNDTGGVEFKVRPKTAGTQTVKITARGSDSADAVIKSMIVVPEGVQREQVENGIINGGASRTITLPLPPDIVPDSARSYIGITGSLLTQTIEGLDQLLQMPFGCGEQNMINLAPDVFILDYLKATNQAKPEIEAKAELLLITGYQRELTYQRSDGSFSAFGDSDPEGSTFLTAFVLKTFAQAKDLVYIDDAVLDSAAAWIQQRQQADGSFESVGFVAHQELMGGIQGKDALTAYAAIALMEAGAADPAERAVAYLEGRLDAIDDPYALALVTYALELGDSGRAESAYDRLMAAAEEDENGLHWGSDAVPEPLPIDGGPVREFAPFAGTVAQSSAIEATGYATLALVAHGDQVNASRAAKWLVSQRNSYGGFGSTQDTVVGLQALTEFAALASSDTDLTVRITAAGETKEVQVTPDNFDVMQMVEVPAGAEVLIEAQGEGQAVYQAVTRYNIPQPEPQQDIYDIGVSFDTTDVNVNDIVGVDVGVTFNPPEPIKAGMTVLDIAVPTGFAPVTETLDALVNADPKVKRYDVAGRKVILYIEDMAPGESLRFGFDIQALYPVRGKGAASQAYSYYNPQWSGETVGEAVTVE